MIRILEQEQDKDEDKEEVSYPEFKKAFRLLSSPSPHAPALRQQARKAAACSELLNLWPQYGVCAGNILCAACASLNRLLLFRAEPS